MPGARGLSSCPTYAIIIDYTRTIYLTIWQLANGEPRHTLPSVKAS